MKLYAKHLSAIFNMPKSCQRVIGYILDNMNDGNEISISLGGRTLMLEKLEMKKQTLSNALGLLVRNKILSMPERSFYIANPSIFTLKKKWGDVMNQKRKFSATIDYNLDTFRISGNWRK